MYIVDFKCENNHRFEGLYDNRAQYKSASDEGTITCPVCDTSNVARLLTTGGVGSSKPKQQSEPEQGMPLFIQKLLSQRIQHIKKHHEFVPPSQFADKVIAMSEHREEQKDVYSEGITPEDTKKLDDRGITYNILPIPDIESN